MTDHLEPTGEAPTPEETAELSEMYWRIVGRKQQLEDELRAMTEARDRWKKAYDDMLAHHTATRSADAVPVPGDGGLREAVEKLPRYILAEGDGPYQPTTMEEDENGPWLRRPDVLALASRLSSVGASADTERREEWVVQQYRKGEWVVLPLTQCATEKETSAKLRYVEAEYPDRTFRLRHRIITERTVEPSALSQEARS